MPEPIEHVHHYVPNEGTVSIKVERNSKGHNWEIKIERPLEAGLSPALHGRQIAADIQQIEQELKERFEGKEAECAGT